MAFSETRRRGLSPGAPVSVNDIKPKINAI